MKIVPITVLAAIFFTQFAFIQRNIQRLYRLSTIQPTRLINVASQYTIGTSFDGQSDLSVEKIPPACLEDENSTECLIQLENVDQLSSEYGDSYNKLPYKP